MQSIHTHTCQYHHSSQLFHGAMSHIMGTRFDLVIITKESKKAELVWKDIVLLLTRLDKLLNRFDPHSELSKINATAHNEPVIVTAEMFSILQLCSTYYYKTNGYFDVSLHDFSKVHLSEKENTVCFSEKMSFDLGGFAKGYALKQICQIVKENGFEDVFIDFGRSSIAAFGHHPHGDCWKVSIENPFDNGKIPGEFELRNASLSTSGNTPSYSGHIIDPFSGKRFYERKMVCVVAPDALDAEVLTTTLMIAPIEEREKIIQHFEIETSIEYAL